MPIFKKQDMWMPNTFYYATERYKSVIEYNNQLYVCTDTHKSNDNFDIAKFSTPSGGGGGSGGRGGFSFGGEWGVETTVAYNDAAFNQTEYATIVNNTFTPTELPSYAYARNILNSTPENGVTKQFKFTWPTLSPTDIFLICFVSSLNSEDISTLDFNQMFGNPNTHMLGMGYYADYASYFSLPNNQIILKRDGNNIPDATNPSVFAATGDDILMSLAGNTLTITNITQSTEMSLVFASTNLDEQITLCIASSVAVEFSLDVQYPIQQALSTVNIPENPIGKTYHVTSTDGSQIFGKLLKVNDFVDFITNEDDEVVDVVVSRLVSDSNIRNTISTALNDPSSSLYSLVRDLGGTAGLDTVVSELYAALNDDNPTNLKTSLDDFLSYLLGYNASLFYNTFQTQVQVAVDAYIQDNMQNGGTIYNAIAQYVEDSTTGVAGHDVIQSAINSSIYDYSNLIGVGYSQVYLDVYVAAQAAISDEIQSGGIIDTAIQSAVNP